MTRFKTLVMAGAAAIVLATGFGSSAFADTPWQQSHPRREQVNDRLANQRFRINHEYREGEISRGQAARLHAADHRVRAEERRMASRHDGHLTRGEQVALNRQENHISRRIGY